MTKSDRAPEPVSEEELGLCAQWGHGLHRRWPHCREWVGALARIDATLARAERAEARLAAVEADYAALVKHHTECEKLGTRLAELVKRECVQDATDFGGGGVDDNVLLEAAAAWDAHQWPSLDAYQEAKGT